MGRASACLPSFVDHKCHPETHLRSGEESTHCLYSDVTHTRQGRSAPSVLHRAPPFHPTHPPICTPWQFEREYDLSIGYLLAHEHILEEHDLGTRFSLDHAVDLRCVSPRTRTLPPRFASESPRHNPPLLDVCIPRLGAVVLVLTSITWLTAYPRTRRYLQHPPLYR